MGAAPGRGKRPRRIPAFLAGMRPRLQAAHFGAKRCNRAGIGPNAADNARRCDHGGHGCRSGTGRRASGRGKSCSSSGRSVAHRGRTAGDPAPHRRARAQRPRCRPAAAGRIRLPARLADSGSRPRLRDAAGSGPARYVVLQAALELARRHYQELMLAGSALANPRATREFLRMRLRDLPLRGVLLPATSTTATASSRFEELFRGTHRRRQRASPRGRQTGAVPQRGRGHPGPQPPVRRRRTQPGRRAHHPPAARRPWRWSISGCSTTWSSATGSASPLPSGGCCKTAAGTRLPVGLASLAGRPAGIKRDSFSGPGAHARFRCRPAP